MNYIKFIIYLFFVFLIALGFSVIYKNENIGLIIFGIGGLTYMFITSTIKYLDKK